MLPCAIALLRFGKRNARATEACLLGWVEQVEHAEREEAVTIVAVGLHCGFVHGEDEHGVRVPRPHRQRIRIEQQPVTPLAVGQCRRRGAADKG